MSNLITIGENDWIIPAGQSHKYEGLGTDLYRVTEVSPADFAQLKRLCLNSPAFLEQGFKQSPSPWSNPDEIGTPNRGVPTTDPAAIFRLEDWQGHPVIRAQGYVGLLQLPAQGSTSTDATDGEENTGETVEADITANRGESGGESGGESVGEATRIEIVPKIWPLASARNKPASSEEATIGDLHGLLARMLNVYFHGMLAFRMPKLATAEIDIYEVFIRAFALELQKLTSRGLLRSYQSHRENSRFFKGKLLTTQHLRINYVHRERFFVEFDRFTPDRAENQILKAIAKLLLKSSQDRDNQQILRQELANFELVSDQSSLGPLFEEVDRREGERGLEPYKLPLQWARIFWNNRSFLPLSGTNRATALFFPTFQLYEDYLAALLEEHLETKNWRLLSQDDRFTFLQDAANPDFFKIRPDLVLEPPSDAGGGGPVIADAKWKLFDKQTPIGLQVQREDLYQVYSYLARYGSTQAVLIYPHSPGLEGKTWQFTSESQSYPQAAISVFFFDLFNEEESLRELDRLIGF